MLDGEIGVLEAAHGVVNVVPLLLLRGDEQQHQVGAGGKIDAWLAMTMASKSPLKRFTPACIMAAMSSPMAFILE